MKNAKQAPEGMVVSSRSQRVTWWKIFRRPTKPAEWLLAGGGALLVVLTIVALAVNLGADSPVRPASSENLPDDYSIMTPAQITKKLMIDTGLDTETLKKGTFKAGTFKNFKIAYEAARALGALKYHDAALRAYGFAEEKRDNTTNYEFYLHYAAEAAGDDTLTATQLDKAKTSIGKDQSLPAALKDELTTKLDARQHLKELGY